MSSIDVADAFLRLHAELNPARVLNQAWTWRRSPGFDDLATEICESALAGVYEARLVDPHSSDAGQRERLAHLTGLDWAFKHVNPLMSGLTVPPGFADIEDRHAEHGRFNSEPADGLLLAKLTLDTRSVKVPDRMGDLFSSVLVAPAPEDSVRFELAPKDAHMSKVERKRLPIACVPMLEDGAELEFEYPSRDDLLWYRIGPDPTATATFDSRIERILDAVSTDETLLALAPELSCTDELLNSWEQHARRVVGDGAELRWVFAGTGNIPDAGARTNTGHLLDAASGTPLLSQSKQFRFNIDAKMQTGDYRLPGLTGAECAHEDIEIGVETTILELGCARIAVLICEDLARAEMLLGDLYRHGVSHIIAPVFSKETVPHYWEQAAAKNYTNAHGASVIVPNSLVLARLVGKTGHVGAALVHAPFGGVVQMAKRPDELLRYVVHLSRQLDALDTPYA